MSRRMTRFAGATPAIILAVQNMATPRMSGKCGYLPSSGRDIAFCYAAALISLMGLFFPTTPNASGIVVSPANRAKATPAALR